MNVKDPNLVLVRGINEDWFKENFSNMWVGFGGSPQAIPKEDSYYVGLYLHSPISAITHIGIVERIERWNEGADFFLKALIKLNESVDPGHAIRKHENWTLGRLGLTLTRMENIRQQLNLI